MTKSLDDNDYDLVDKVDYSEKFFRWKDGSSSRRIVRYEITNDGPHWDIAYRKAANDDLHNPDGGPKKFQVMT